MGRRGGGEGALHCTGQLVASAPRCPPANACWGGAGHGSPGRLLCAGMRSLSSRALSHAFPRLALRRGGRSSNKRAPIPFSLLPSLYSPSSPPLPFPPTCLPACPQADYDHYHDSSSTALTLDLEKCIKCGRCVTMCNQVQASRPAGRPHPGRLGNAIKGAGLTPHAQPNVECTDRRAACLALPAGRRRSPLALPRALAPGSDAKYC